MSEPPCERPPRRAFAWLCAGVFALALALRLALVAQYEERHPLAQHPVIDEGSYDRWARAIAGGDLFGEGIFFQEPLYPYALACVYALAGDDPLEQRAAARRVQAVLGAATAVLVALLGRALFGRAAGLVAGIAFALYRPAVWMCALLLKPVLVLPLVVLLALALARTRRLDALAPAARARRLGAWLAAGVLAGFGALLRGNLLVLSPAFVLWPIVRARLQGRPARDHIGSAAAVLLGLALVLAPVALRNLAAGGRLVLTTGGAGTNLYAGNSLLNPHGVATELPWVRGIPEHEAGDWRREAERRTGRDLDAVETSSYWMGETLRSFAEHPIAHLAILWRKLRATLSSYEVPDNHALEWDARHVPLLAVQLPGFGLWGWLGLGGLGAFAWGALRGRRIGRDKGAALETAALLALYLATIVLTVTSDRTRLGLVPLLLPFAGWAAVELAGAIRRRRVPLPLVASLGLAAGLVFVPALPERERQADLDERDFNLAAVLVRSGELERAEPVVGALEERRGASPRVQHLAAELDYRRARGLLDAGAAGEAEGARAARLIERALRRLAPVAERGNPQERFRADVLAGAILQYLGHWPEAAAAYRSALGFDPDDPDVRRRLAVSLAEEAMTLPPGEERSRELRVAERLLAELLDETGEAEIGALLERIRAQLGGE